MKAIAAFFILYAIGYFIYQSFIRPLTDRYYDYPYKHHFATEREIMIDRARLKKQARTYRMLSK